MLACIRHSLEHSLTNCILCVQSVFCGICHRRMKRSLSVTAFYRYHCTMCTHSVISKIKKLKTAATTIILLCSITAMFLFLSIFYRLFWNGNGHINADAPLKMRERIPFENFSLSVRNDGKKLGKR